MKSKNLGDVVIGACIMLFSAFFWFESRDYAYEVKTFPRIFLGVLAVSALAIFVRGLLAYQKERKLAAAQRADGTYVPEAYDDRRTDLPPRALQLLPYAGLLMILLYILAIKYIGFFVSTAVFMLAAMRLLQMRKWWLMIAITAGIEVFIYLAFVMAFAIRLPNGILF